MRLDVYLTEHGYAPTRTKAQALIRAGAVTVDGKCIVKPSFDLDSAEISVRSGELRYVGRGGLKLEAALDAFGIDVHGLSCVDIGASTGGFTDCLLQRGAASVLCVDSGTDQLHASLRSDPRVRVLERFNARALTPAAVGGTVKCAVMDVSFISQTLLYPAVGSVLSKDGVFISLVKPQFEAGKDQVGKNGIVKRRVAHRAVLDKIAALSRLAGLFLARLICSPITGGDGNTEYLALFYQGTDVRPIDFDAIIPEYIK